MVAFKATKSVPFHYKIFAVQKSVLTFPWRKKKSQPFLVTSFLQSCMCYKTKKETVFTQFPFSVMYYIFFMGSPLSEAMLQLNSLITSVRPASLFSMRTNKNQLNTTGNPKSFMKAEQFRHVHCAASFTLTLPGPGQWYAGVLPRLLQCRRRKC